MVAVVAICWFVAGKSALCTELQKHVIRQRGLFVRAKFEVTCDTSNSCTPLLQSFRTLLLQLVAMDDIVWRVRLQQSMTAESLSLLADVLPELDKIIGPAHPSPPLVEHEREAQTRQAFAQLVSCLSSPESPLTLVLDNVQWAGTEVLHLLHQMFTHVATGAGFLLLVVSYRPVEEGHPLIEFIQSIKRSSRAVTHSEDEDNNASEEREEKDAILAESLGRCHLPVLPASSSVSASSVPPSSSASRVVELSLKPLATQDIEQLLQDSFPRSNQPIDTIAHIMQSKTQGRHTYTHTRAPQAKQFVELPPPLTH